jgi:hypothetical protein
MVADESPGVGIDDIEITFVAGLLTDQSQRHVDSGPGVAA